jgi:hypothetical protein
MRYKVSTTGDLSKIIDFLQKYNILHGTNRRYIVAVDEMNSNDIKGLVGIETAVRIEPLIAENPMIAFHLYANAEGFLIAHNILEVEAIISSMNPIKDRVENQLKKLGFYELGEFKIYKKFLI